MDSNATCPCALCARRRDRAEVWRISGLLTLLTLAAMAVAMRGCWLVMQ